MQTVADLGELTRGKFDALLLDVGALLLAVGAHLLTISLLTKGRELALHLGHRAGEVSQLAGDARYVFFSGYFRQILRQRSTIL